MANSSAAELRQRILAQRKILSAAEIQEGSRTVCQRFLNLSGFDAPALHSRLRALAIGLYQAMPGELSLQDLEAVFQQRGARLHYPRIGTGPLLDFVEVSSREQAESWEAGPYRIRQPRSDQPAAALASLKLIIVPGVVFGEQGERIGMGAGYYDRLLPHATNALRVALAFDFQLVPVVEQNPWDQPVDWIVTESREFRSARVLSWLESENLR